MLFSVLSFLEHSANKLGEKVAITDSDTRLTFANLRERAQASAQALVDLGIRPGDRIGICMAKSTDQVVAILASLYANAIFVPILPALKHDSIAHIVRDSGLSAIITDPRRLLEVSSFKASAKILIGSGELTESLPNLPYLSRHLTAERLPGFMRLGVDLAAIIYSSGSTGRPKGIMVTHRNLSDGARIVAHYLNTAENDRIASILSFNFDYGLNQIWQSLLTGASLHLHELIMPNDCISFIVKEKITAVPLMPAIMTRLFDPRFLQRERNVDLSAVRYVCSSGGRVSSVMLQNVKEVFPNAKFFAMYGLTEAFRSTYLPPDQLPLRPNSIGKAIPDVEILVLDDDGNECPPGTIGELVHRGGCIARGYWNDEKKTAERFRKHFRYPGEILVYSGDLVVKDEDGYITFINRKDGMLKNNGMRISPTEIEETAEQHPAVCSAVAFGIENIEVGQDIVLAYTINNKKQLSEVELLRFLKANLASHMVPRYIINHQDFVTTGNQGKIDRLAVRDTSLKMLGLAR
jgi:amino acid adenylation domain-containing protein